MVEPLISVIVVVFNAKSTIEDCIKSVLTQDRLFELIVIDGLSQDGTMEILKRFKNDISYFVSERDNGIYDAMNKGINAANGRYIYFLGADDVFYNSEVLTVIRDYLIYSEPDLLFGNIIYETSLIVKPRFNSLLLLHNTIHHQGTFYSANLFKNFRYDTRYTTFADYELNLLCYSKRAGLKISSVDKIFARCASNGVSQLTPELFIKETNSIRSRYVNSYFNFVYSIVLTLKYQAKNIFY